MGRYGTFPYASQPYGHLFDYVSAREAALMSRPPPGQTAVPPAVAGRRTAYAAICTFDPLTWTVGDPLPLIAPGASEQYSLVADRWPNATLSFTVQDPDRYLDPGDLWPLIRPGAGLIVQRRLTDEFGKVWINSSPPYVVHGPPSRDDDFQGGNPLGITALDRLQYLRLRTESTSGYMWLRGKWDNFAAAEALGVEYGGEIGRNSPRLNADGVGLSSFLQFNTAWLFTTLGGHVRVEWNDQPSEDMYIWWYNAQHDFTHDSQLMQTLSWGGDVQPVEQPPPSPIQLAYGSGGWVPVTSAGQRVSFEDALNWSWGGSPYRLCWARDGTLILRPVKLDHVSGWAAVRGPVRDAAMYVPWEAMSLQLGEPTARAVVYQLTFTPPPQPATRVTAGGGGSISEQVAVSNEGFNVSEKDMAVIRRRNVGAATSRSARFPFRPDFDTPQAITERDIVVQARGWGTGDPSPYPGTAIPIVPNQVGQFDDYCNYVLGLALGAAERVTLTVDNGIAPPEMGTTLPVVNLPKGINALYRLTSVTRPLDLAAATWGCDWIRDL
jgi:hypothetical protein